jgi:hypothetical protein
MKPSVIMKTKVLMKYRHQAGELMDIACKLDHLIHRGNDAYGAISEARGSDQVKEALEHFRAALLSLDDAIDKLRKANGDHV